jgi:hypothetical protein
MLKLIKEVLTYKLAIWEVLLAAIIATCIVSRLSYKNKDWEGSNHEI